MPYIILLALSQGLYAGTKFSVIEQGRIVGVVESLDRFPTPDDVRQVREWLQASYKLSKGHARFIAHHASAAGYYYDLPTELLIAHIKVESGFQPKAKSRVNAIGYMQVRPYFWRGESPHDM